VSSLLLAVLAVGITTCGVNSRSTDQSIPFVPIDVSTYHYDNARDGLNAHETILNLQNVTSQYFGKVALVLVDGAVDAEPLLAANLLVGGKMHNVLYVVTEHDSVYAMDADTGAIIWQKSVLGAGEVPSDPHNCGGITPEIGITATPVIDRAQGPNGRIFFVAMTRDASGGYHQRLHALDLALGSEATSGPTEIAGRFPGTGDNSQGGFVIFDPGQYAARTALLLVNGTLYFGWTSHQDQRPYTGWIMGYSETTLQQTQILNLTPNGTEGAIWMSGNGLAADGAGNIYLLDANGTFDSTFDAHGFPANGDYGNSILKLSPASGKLAVADYFTAFNNQALNDVDADLGSGGEILLPDMTDSTGAVRHLIAGAGKDQNIYLADRDNLGKFNTTSADNHNLYQEVDAAFIKNGGIWSTPAYFNGTLYYGGIFDQVKAFRFTDAKLANTPSSASSTVYPYPGTTPAVSANGISNGIVWAVESSLQKPAVLHAYDASNLAHELYNSNQAVNSRDYFGFGNKFITPLVANGKVYIGTQKGVAIFGLLPTNSSSM
jgi:outer membrane protein assembly factor BamB